jgi:YHS domain-containing protein
VNYLNEEMQAVAMIVCEKHAPSLLEKLQNCPEGNWFVMPAVGACRVGYWPHVSQAHSGGGCAVWGFAERLALVRTLGKLASVNDDGSLCPDCVAYQWSITPVHLADTVRDPVCGRNVSSNSALSHHYQGELFFFCSMGCRDDFIKSPQRYVRQPVETLPTPQPERVRV